MPEDAAALRRRLRTTALAWVALLALMFTSLRSAYLELGIFNVVAGLVVAALKASLVAWVFMRLREAGPLLRVAAALGLGMLAIQFALTGVDYLTRPLTPAAVEQPEQTRGALPDRGFDRGLSRP